MVLASLNEGFSHPVRDVLWGHVYFTERLENLINSGAFLRLHRIFQLGPVHFVYPGATHTRASHSIGVYHLGRRLLRNLCERGAENWLTKEGAFSFLCACLLHDLGHFPFTHSLKELPLRTHENLTASIILAEPIKSLVAKCGADPFFTAAIIDTDYENNDYNKYNGYKNLDRELLFYRKLLSGCLDPDKLDYLNRDARFCGVPYGAQDVDFVFSRLIPNIDRGADIDSRLIPNVEAIIFAKYLMYRSVYWHHEVRAATSMIKKAVLQGLQNKEICKEELYNLDDQGLFGVLSQKSCANFANAVWNGNLYSNFAEIPFDETLHAPLKNIFTRHHLEEALANAISKEFKIKGLDSSNIIIDLPENISFETNLFVQDENKNFNESSSAFKTETLASFTKSLHRIRIFINPNFNNMCFFNKKLLTTSNIYDILKDIVNNTAS